MENSHMYYHEKIFFGTMNLVAAACSLFGAIMSDAEARWIYVTLAVGIIVSCSMALMTRRDESMQIVAGRFLFSVITTVFGTRILPHFFPKIDIIKEDFLLLGAMSGGVCVVAFTVGYGLIRSLNDEKLSLGKWVKDLLLFIITPKK